MIYVATLSYDESGFPKYRSAVCPSESLQLYLSSIEAKGDANHPEARSKFPQDFRWVEFRPDIKHPLPLADCFGHAPMGHFFSERAMRLMAAAEPAIVARSLPLLIDDLAFHYLPMAHHDEPPAGGLDIFSPWLSLKDCCTEDLKTLWEKHQLTGLEFDKAPPDIFSRAWELSAKMRYGDAASKK